MKIKAQALTQDSFDKYGAIISNSAAAPMADNTEITYWGKVSVLQMGEAASTGIMLAHHRQPIVTQMERHVKTPEILAAVEGDSVVCLAPPSYPGKEITDIKAFIIRQGDAVALHAGTWHWAGYPMQKKSAKFIVVFANGTEAEDLEIIDAPETIEIAF